MPQIAFSRGAYRDLARLYRFLAVHDFAAATRAMDVINARIKQLQVNAAIGRFVEESGNLRELVIPFGSTGYVALYRFDELRDTVFILAVRHQREGGYSSIV